MNMSGPQLSMYSVLGVPEAVDKDAPEQRRASVSTRETATIETIDNDRAAAAFGVLLPG